MVRDRLRDYGDIEFADMVAAGMAKVRFKSVVDADRARGTCCSPRPLDEM